MANCMSCIVSISTPRACSFSARNKRSLEHLNKSFRERDTHKIYEARLEGVISEQQGRIELPLALNWLDRPRQCSLTENGGGKASATEFVVIGTQQTAGGPKTLVRLSPVTAARISCVCIAPKGSVAPLTATPFTVIRDLKAKPMPRACVCTPQSSPSYIRLPANRSLSRRRPIFRISDNQKRCVAQTDSRIENFCYPSACAMIRKSPVGRACQ